MKSIQGVVEAKCPHCAAAEFEAEIWSFIRADSEPELKEAILYGELNLLECSECKNFFYYESPLVYFDPAAELLVFLLPLSYESDSLKWREKMAADFASIKNGLASEMKIDYEPLVLFGAETLKQLLEGTLDEEDENAAIAATAKSLGFKTTPLKPSVARACGYPNCLPHEGAECDAESFVSAAVKILASGLESGRLKKMLAEVNSDTKSFPKL